MSNLASTCREIKCSLPSPHEVISVRILISLPPTYPASSPPQLQLLSRYIGAFGADADLFGTVLRTFISANGVEWTPDVVCVFDGLQSVLERCTTWYQNRLSMEQAGELLRADAKVQLADPATPPSAVPPGNSPPTAVTIQTLPDGLQIFTAEPITDRKSVFVGRACAISNPCEACC